MTVYLLLGDDEERKSRGVDKLRAGRAADAYDASEISPETLVSACNSLSLFGEGPFVVLKDLDSWNAAQKAVIVDYLKNPSPGSDLLLLGKRLGARERLLSAVKNSGEVHTFDQPTGKALVRWLVGHAKRLDLDLPEDVAEDLANRCSEDKMRLLQETEKLSLYVGDGTATHEDVAALCPPDVQSNIFAFVDSLAAGERDRALALLEDLIGTGEPPLRLTFMIRRQFQLIARARALIERGIPRKEIASRLKVPPFVARKLEEQGGQLDEENPERALGLVQDLESGLKGGSYLSDELQVEMTVLSLSENSA
jgi:DNA polymerase-3 subunit delta